MAVATEADSRKTLVDESVGMTYLDRLPRRAVVLYLPLEYMQAPESQLEIPRLPALAQPPQDDGEPAAPEKPQAPKPADDPLEGKKVLVVDDDIRNVFALASALEQHGLQVAHADSGKEGIEVLKASTDIDFVLMDVMMPGLDGIDTMRIVRKLEGYDRLPIIAVTAKAMPGDRERCIDAGATDYVAKPVNVDSLLGLLRSLA